MKRKAIFLLYRVLLGLASPLVLLYLLSRGAGYRRTIPERLGHLPPTFRETVGGSIWLHAVSVGEVLAAIPLIDELAKRSQFSAIYLSVSTLAGKETAEKRLAGKVAGVFRAPLDFAWVVRRVLRHLRPAVVVVMETEIWPNLFREAKRLGCGLVILNGRISDRALPSYRRWSWLFAEVLGLCDRIVTQSEEMRERFILAGAPAAVVSVGGNLKYDFAAPGVSPESPALRFLAADSVRPVWIAASTSADDSLAEEDFVISAQRDLPGWRLIVAPRKPERFAEVAAKLAESGFRWTRRTDLTDPLADVLLLDSIGELSGLFAFATVVFMGGTLANRGGHNILEPAVFGKPVIAGPHLENFRDIEAHFTARKALPRIASGDELAGAVREAASDPGVGARAREAAGENRGATARATETVLQIRNSTYPVFRPPQPAFAFLWAMAKLWKIGSAWDRRSKSARARRLPVPVVSVGNITAGGTGKTPMIVELLRDFGSANPGLLTRGHGRQTRDIVLMLPGENPPSIRQTGDEARLCFDATRAPVGIGADRYEAGLALIQAAKPGLLFLDDGFQHLQLERDFNLVLIDALNPFGAGELLPLGRLREPPEGLARADAFVITRAEEVPDTRAIESQLNRYNPSAPIFRARTGVRRQEGCTAKAVAFCGLGNPDAFWKTLDSLNVKPLATFTFSDHHPYKCAELRRLARQARDLGAEVLLTTAKDKVNLPADYSAAIAPLKLCVVEIGLEIEGREELLRLIGKWVEVVPTSGPVRTAT